MDEVEKFNAAETVIPLLIAKLNNVKDKNQITDPILVRQVVKSMEILTEVEKYLEDKEGSPNDLNPELLQTIYRVEDDIDIFLVRTKFQKLGVVFAEIHLKYVHIQALLMKKKMNKLVSDLEKEWKFFRYPLSKNAKQSKEIHSARDKRSGISNLVGRVKELAELILSDDSSPFPIPVIDVEGSATTTELRKIYNHVQVKDHFECRAWVAVGQEFDKSQLLRYKKSSPCYSSYHGGNAGEIVKYAFPNSADGTRVISSFRAADVVRYPNIIFYGRNPALNSGVMRVSYAKTNVVFDDNATTEQQVSGEDEISDEETDIVGLKDKILELAKRIDEHSVVVVVGDAGSGKTTLVKTIYDSSLIRQSFGYRAWVNVYISDHYCDMKNVLISILKQVTKLAKDEEELPPHELETNLRKTSSGKKFLLVLDDVHLPSAWYDFRRILLPLSDSRVILITRKDTVAQSVSPSVSPSFVFQLRSLNKYESSQLFLKMVRKDESPDLIDMKEMVWKICRGLPLGICVLGGLFCTGNYSSLIKKARFGEEQSISPDSLASSIWKLAHKILSPRFRAYIHYLCLFPKSDEVPVRRLFHLWLAERLVTPSGEEELEELVNKDIEDLENMRIIQVVRRRSNGKPKTCNVTSSLYDTFCQNSHDMGSFHVNSNKSNSTSNSRKVCIRRFAEHIDIQKNPPSSDEGVKHLHSFISFNTRKDDKPSEELGFNLVPIDEFENLKELYLLGMLPRGFDISRFPPKLQILTLSLSQLSNDPMPMLGKLKHLKTLRLFAHSYIGERLTCPKDTFPELLFLKLWVLKELKHWTINDNAMPVLKQLEIRYCQKLKKIDGLENVRTLKEIILTNMEKDFVDEVRKRLGEKKVATETIDQTWTQGDCRGEDG
ncbi:hypothetical protein Pint_29271 [Pistacia integerrima]|uniref:Uncharacterized protein n=1 Tax=Pistacia integerrima TaxID=434235 RepID=A0ACC0WYR8_9ROSI|nr:hypothetical protein Pint_29271 [Pistacia integerrima]